MGCQAGQARAAAPLGRAQSRRADEPRPLPLSLPPGRTARDRRRRMVVGTVCQRACDAEAADRTDHPGAAPLDRRSRAATRAWARVRLDLTAAPALELFARLIRQGFREVHEALPERSRAAFRAGGRPAIHEIVVPFASP